MTPKKGFSEQTKLSHGVRREENWKKEKTGGENDQKKKNPITRGARRPREQVQRIFNHYQR